MLVIGCDDNLFISFTQQRKLMASSAQNSSGVHWCRCRVRFNEVPEKVPKVPEKVWEAFVHSQVRFNRVPKKVPVKVPGGFGAEPGQVQQGSGEGCREGLGGFGAEPGQVQQGSGEASREGLGGFGAKPGQVEQGSGEGSGGSSGEGPEGCSGEGSGRLWCRARSGSTGFWRRLRRRGGWLWCSQVRFNRVSEKVWEALQGKVRFNRVPENVPESVGGFGAEPGWV